MYGKALIAAAFKDTLISDSNLSANSVADKPILDAVNLTGISLITSATLSPVPSKAVPEAIKAPDTFLNILIIFVFASCEISLGIVSLKESENKPQKDELEVVTFRYPEISPLPSINSPIVLMILIPASSNVEDSELNPRNPLELLLTPAAADPPNSPVPIKALAVSEVASSIPFKYFKILLLPEPRLSKNTLPNSSIEVLTESAMAVGSPSTPPARSTNLPSTYC